MQDIDYSREQKSSRLVKHSKKSATAERWVTAWVRETGLGDT